MDEIQKLLGPFPRPTQLNSEVVEEVDCGSYVRQKVYYDVEEGDRVPAYICLPKNLIEPAPVVYCHHQHNGEFDMGKSEVVGLAGNPDQAYAAELAERGYVTFSPDAICFEEREGAGQWYELSTRLVQGKTLMAKVLHDIRVGIDYLETRNEVDSSKLGFIGHSYGGRMALWAPAFDERIRAAVSHCGCIDYRHSMGPEAMIQMELCVPGFAVNHDLEDLISEFKNCPLLVQATTDDKWSWGHEQLVDRARQKGKDDIYLKVFDAEHVFTKPMRENAYQFLDSYLLS